MGTCCDCKRKWGRAVMQEEVGTNCDCRRKWGRAMTAGGGGNEL